MLTPASNKRLDIASGIALCVHGKGSRGSRDGEGWHTHSPVHAHYNNNSETGEINSGKPNSTYIPHRFDTTTSPRLNGPGNGRPRHRPAEIFNSKSGGLKSAPPKVALDL